jgi:hypothetical protein
LKLTIREWDGRLKRMPNGGHARLLESLTSSIKSARPQNTWRQT